MPANVAAGDSRGDDKMRKQQEKMEHDIKASDEYKDLCTLAKMLNALVVLLELLICFFVALVLFLALPLFAANQHTLGVNDNASFMSSEDVNKWAGSIVAAAGGAVFTNGSACFLTAVRFRDLSIADYSPYGPEAVMGIFDQSPWKRRHLFQSWGVHLSAAFWELLDVLAALSKLDISVALIRLILISLLMRVL
jgi:hypothetical protein